MSAASQEGLGGMGENVVRSVPGTKGHVGPWEGGELGERSHIKDFEAGNRCLGA